MQAFILTDRDLYNRKTSVYKAAVSLPLKEKNPGEFFLQCLLKNLFLIVPATALYH